MTPAATRRSQTCWATPGKGGDDADGDAVLVDDLLEAVAVLHGDPGDLLSGHLRIGVDQRGDPETTGGEPAVVGQRGAEVTDTDDHYRPVLGQAQLTGDLVHEILDVVPHTTRPVGAEVGEVFAQLRGVDPRRGRELLGGDRRVPSAPTVR